jgi:hypothetical protein
MNDLRTLLSDAAGTPAVADPIVDADLARAHRAWRRRSVGLTVASAATVGAAIAVAGVVAGGPGTPAPARVGSAPPVTAPRKVLKLRPATKLVAYGGRQPSGYRVAAIPSGWEIQGANAFRLTIAKIGDPDQIADAFEGKLVVMLRSASAEGPPPGRAIRVGEGTGYVDHQGDTAILTYRDQAKHWVVVQSPDTLGWSDQNLARFGAGVEVLKGAQAGVG